jgi:hypothetical protein
VAQLGARLNGIEEVRGSSPLSSTRHRVAAVPFVTGEGALFLGHHEGLTAAPSAPSPPAAIVPHVPVGDRSSALGNVVKDSKPACKQRTLVQSSRRFAWGNAFHEPNEPHRTRVNVPVGRELTADLMACIMRCDIKKS